MKGTRLGLPQRGEREIEWVRSYRGWVEREDRGCNVMGE